MPCSKWATKNRVMGEPFPGAFSYDHHPWLLTMHDLKDDEAVGQKAAQMGFTEWAINMAFYQIEAGRNVLYVLPTSSDASDFSSSRFDPSLDASKHLQSLFVDVNNVRLKRTRNATLYIRGSKSRAKLKSIPAAVVILDEMDEMPEESINLVMERQSGQVFTLTLKLSTPSIEDFGINADYKLSTQDLFVFQCPGCSRFIDLEYPRNFKLCGDNLTDPRLLESYFYCHLCDKKLDFEEKVNFLKAKELGGTAHFVEQFHDRPKRGYRVHQMYSMAKAGRPSVFAFSAMKAEFDATYAQEFWNSKLGLPYTARGAKITDDQIHAAKRDYSQEFIPEKLGVRTLGVDVGLMFHCTIYEWKIGEPFGDLNINDVSRPKLIKQIAVRDENQLDELISDYQIDGFIIDAEPERRLALSFVQRYNGIGYTCDYLFSQQGKEISASEEELTAKVNRTAWLDQTMFRYKNGTIDLPHDIDEEFKAHIKEPVRITRRDKWGQEYGVYVNKKADHYAHSSTYAELALPLTVEFGENRSIKGPY